MHANVLLSSLYFATELPKLWQMVFLFMTSIKSVISHISQILDVETGLASFTRTFNDMVDKHVPFRKLSVKICLILGSTKTFHYYFSKGINHEKLLGTLGPPLTGIHLGS